MKLLWFVKELMAVLIILALSIGLIIWAAVELSNSSDNHAVLALGLASGFIPILTEFLISYRNNTLFLKDKDMIATKRAKNTKLARSLLVPSVAFGLVFAYFPGSIKIFLLSLAAGYLLPYSLALLIHFLKNHKEIEKATKNT